MLVILILLLLLSGDIEKHPGPSSLFSSDKSKLSSVSELSLDDLKFCLSKFISFVHLNVQSLEPKLDLINVELLHLDILCFTETWLKPDFHENDVLLDNFIKPFRHDRVDRIGGGVAVYVKSYLSAKRICDLEVSGVESVWLELKLKQKQERSRLGPCRPTVSSRKYQISLPCLWYI
ncbi:unnamed protein product [Mytilus coruscus]|uniref:Endonuclease/exonuclease/phosphatase domain-containing protein n=1 Tax=Mytilus coruscus TaxID=42192 RepID=A0A6J8ELM1_MYTCO|nr:unnamed protein product [Mytilus coruscus]